MHRRQTERRRKWVEYQPVSTWHSSYWYTSKAIRTRRLHMHQSDEKCIFQQKKKGILLSEKLPKWRTGISISLCTLTSSSPGVPLWAPPIAPGSKGLTDRGPTSVQTQNCNPQFHLLKGRQQLGYLSMRLSCSALCWYSLTSSHSLGQHNIRRIEKTETMSKEGLQR